MPGLDGMRALAVIAVVWHHTQPGVTALPQASMGFLGVDVFFVLSGFLITTLLLEEHARYGRISLRHFYARRTLRIFPLYYALLGALALHAVVAPGTSQHRAQFLAELPIHASYASNWIHTKTMALGWSLSSEEQFYLLWPPVLAWLGRRALWPLVVLLGFNQAINFGALDGWLTAIGLPYSDHSILQVTFTPILLGVLLAFALQDARARGMLERAIRWPALMVALAVAVAATSVDDVRGAPRLAFHLATTVVLAGVVLRPTSATTRWLQWRPLTFIGTVSYGVYLLHMFVLVVAARGLAWLGLEFPWLLFFSCLIGTVGLAALSYRYLERPLLRLKDRFRQRFSPQGPTQTPVHDLSP